MNARTILISLFWVVSLILLNACDVLTTPIPATPVPGLVKTLAAQTVTADSHLAELRLSQTPEATQTPSPTETLTLTPSGPPTATAFPTVPTELFAPQQAITDTLQATIDPASYPTPDFSRTLEDGSPAPCNAMKFIEDITVPDEMRVAIGEKFTKIWRVQNIGACAWTPEYAWVKTYGNDFDVTPPIWIDRIVNPGEMYDLILNMKAPLIPACWQSNWMLQDPEGIRFGVSYKFAVALHVVVSVYLPRISFLRDPCKVEANYGHP
jgi:hypothetical protein